MILLPVLTLWCIDRFFLRSLSRKRTIIHAYTAMALLAICLSAVIYLGWRYKALILLGLLLIPVSIWIKNKYKIGLVLLGLMSVVAVLQVSVVAFGYSQITHAWQQNITTNPTLLRTPNIYLIQPDGHSSLSTLQASPYEMSTHHISQLLATNGLTEPPEYRSNYPSTLTSNASLFTGSHHYYHGKKSNELYGARDLIMGDNFALNTLQKSGYQLNAVLQEKYLLLNHPEHIYDRINITRSEWSWLPQYQAHKDVVKDLNKMMQHADSLPQFYFIEYLSPGHITGKASQSQGKLAERVNYAKRLTESREILTALLESISQKDPDGLVIIAADHGGFVGLDYTEEVYEREIKQPEIKNSIYHCLLATKGPDEFTRIMARTESSVSLFHHLFYYLSDKQYTIPELDNASYQWIKTTKKPKKIAHYTKQQD